ncbi:MAG: hypothetical protein ABTS16_12855 [Candidatus Accumulibacter phosphatis]
MFIPAQDGLEQMLPSLDETTTFHGLWPAVGQRCQAGSSGRCNFQAQTIDCHRIGKESTFDIGKQAGYQHVRLTFLAEPDLQRIRTDRPASCLPFDPGASRYRDGFRITLLHHCSEARLKQRMRQAVLARNGPLWWLDFHVVVGYNVEQIAFIGPVGLFSVYHPGKRLSGFIQERDAISILRLGVDTNEVPPFFPVDLADRGKRDRGGVRRPGPCRFSATQAGRTIIPRHHLGDESAQAFDFRRLWLNAKRHAELLLTRPGDGQDTMANQISQARIGLIRLDQGQIGKLHIADVDRIRTDSAIRENPAVECQRPVGSILDDLVRPFSRISQTHTREEVPHLPAIGRIHQTELQCPRPFGAC